MLNACASDSVISINSSVGNSSVDEVSSCVDSSCESIGDSSDVFSSHDGTCSVSCVCSSGCSVDCSIIGVSGIITSCV